MIIDKMKEIRMEEYNEISISNLLKDKVREESREIYSKIYLEL